MTEEERATAVALISANPEVGDLVTGSAGLRKVRVPRKGKGKSGGYRVLTYFFEPQRPVYLVAALSKSKQANFTPAQVKLLAQVAKAIRDER